MKITEYRIILPTAVAAYRIGNLYMVAKRTRETRGGGEGIEILVNEPYEKPDGERGQYTHKVLHFKSRIPSFIRWMIPDKYLHVEEKSHNGYPHYHTVYECAGMGDSLYCLVESQHLEYDKEAGCPDNVLGLSDEDIAIRQVVYLDIVNGLPKPDKPEWNLDGFVCPEAGIEQPLSAGSGKRDTTKPPEWVQQYSGPLMIAVKMAKLNFRWRGLQTAVESYAMSNAFWNIFLESNRVVMAAIKEWHTMTLDDIRGMEAQVQGEQAEVAFDRDQ
jgi:hypothetical protein